MRHVTETEVQGFAPLPCSQASHIFALGSPLFYFHGDLIVSVNWRVK